MLETSRSLRLAAAAALSVLAFISGCADDTSGPAGFRTGQLALVPDFGVLQPDIIAIVRGRFVVTRIPGGTVAADTVIDIAPDADSVALGILVPVFNQDETFNLTIRLIDSAGDTVFAAGPVEVSPTTSSTPVPIEVPFTYVGTGANAAWIEITSPDTSLFSGETVLLTAMAFDSSDAVIPGTPIGWESLDTAHVGVVTDAQYRAVATGGSQRGTAPIVATLVTGQQDTVFVGNQPLPATLVAESGNDQSAWADSTLPLPLVARVTAADGLGVRGLWVRFAVTSGGGTVSADSVVTDSTGRASVSWTLARSFQPHVVTATTARLGTASATFTATLVFEPPATLEIVAGDGQSGTAGTAVAVPPQVRVRDASGLPVPGVVVTFAVTGGGGIVAGGTPVTDTLGLAAVTSWTLGTTVGFNTLTATVNALTTTFNATGNAGPATRLAFTGEPSTVAQDSIIRPPVAVTAYDAFDNVATGFLAAVEVALLANPGGAVLGGTTSVEAYAGVATYGNLTLSTAGVGYTLLATSAGLTPDTSAAFEVLAPVRAIRWINPEGGSWESPANWDVGRVPTADDTVAIDLAGGYTVQVTGTAAAATLRIGGDGSSPTVRVSTNSGTASLTVADGLTNAGAIVLHDDASNASASLTVTAGTLVNTGLIEAAGNWGGGTRTITATVDNQGTVYTYNMPLTILNTGRTFTTTAGTLNTGSYAQVLTVAGGTVLFGSGTQLTGGGTVTLPTGTALQLATDFTFGAGSATLNLAGENAGLTVSGPGALIVANPTRPLVLGTDTVTAPLSIQDTLKVRAPSVATGTVDISGTGVLYLRATVLADLTVADGLTNAGTIVLHDEAGNASASLTLTAGTLVNTGLIEAAGAWGGGTRTLTATVDNQGTISTNNMPLTVVNTGRTFTTTAGTLNTGSYAQLLTIAGGTVLFGSGTQLSGNGTVTLPVGTALQLATDFTFGAGSARLDLAGENAGITVSGPGALIVANPTRPLVLGTDTITAPLSIQDTLKVRAPSVVTGTVDISGTGVLYLRSTVLAALTVADGLTNAGTIVLHDEAGNASASLTLTAGTLVSTGLIQTAANWGGGTRTITGNVDLRGTLTIGFPLSIVGQLISPAGAAATVNGNGSTLPVTGLDVDGITFNNTPLASTGGTIIRFDNVTFQNMNAGAVQFTVNHPGAATPFVFTGVRFLTTPTTGRYVRADDTDTGDGNVLTLDFVGATPPDGSAFEEELNGAVINWTVLAGINDWLPGSGVWSDPGKWSLGRVPIPGDTVRITAGGDYTVTMDVSATVARLLLGGTTDIVALNAAGYGLTVTDPGPALEILPFGYLQLAETGLVADQITNEGTIIAGDALIESALITNVGTLDVQYGPVTVYHATAGDLRTSGTLVVQNDAMLTLSTGGSLTYLGGEIAGASGTGVIRLLSNVPLVLGADLTVNNLIIESADGAVLPETGQLLTIGQYATFRAIGSGTTVILASVAVDGIIDIQSGTVVLGGTAALNSQGILQGVGALDVTGLTGTGALTGSIRPGDQPGAPAGILTWFGDFAPDPGAELAIDLGGYQAGTQHDRFDVVGGAELDGILRVTLQNGFVPEPGTRIPIMTFTAAQFGFAQLAFPDLGTLQLDTLTVDGGANPDTLYLVASIVSQPSSSRATRRAACPPGCSAWSRAGPP
jgi:hypothetical protein